MKARIGFVDTTGKKGKDFGWDAITFFQGNPIVHVFLVFDLGLNDVVYETTSTTYHKMWLGTRLAGCNIHLFDLPGDGTKAHAYCESILGTVYDYPGITGLGAMMLGERIINWIMWPYKKLTGIKKEFHVIFVGNPLHVKSALYCAEATTIAIRKMGEDILPKWWKPESTTAPQMFKYAQDMGWNWEYIAG